MEEVTATRKPKVRRNSGGPYVSEIELCSTLLISREAAHKLRYDPIDPMPCMKAGRRILYRLDEVERWMRRRAEREIKARRSSR